MPEHLINPETPPYRACFEAIERTAQAQELSPIEAYRLYDSFLVQRQLDPTIYLSMAITSGGHKRDDQLAMGEVIARNTEFGSLAAGALIQQHPAFDRRDIIVPSELGKVNGWSQADYLLFWSHVILGATPEIAEIIEDSVNEKGVKGLEGFYNSTLDDGQRWRDYAELISTYVDAYDATAATQPNNMQAAVFILDQQMSLGARAEDLLCRRLGISPQIQPLDLNILSHSEVDFYLHVQQLRFLGASALGTELNNQPGFMHVGIGQGTTDVAFAARHGVRKTGLFNALTTKEYYATQPSRKPARHQGHRPLPADWAA